VYEYNALTGAIALPPEANAFHVAPRLQMVCDLAKFYDRQSVLDVGSSDGVLLCKLSHENIISDGDGIELSTPRCYTAEGIKAKWGITNVSFHNMMFEEYTTAKKYDLVVFGEILEHVIDPIVTLKMAKTLLKTGGMVIVTVPIDTASLSPQEIESTLIEQNRQHVRKIGPDTLFGYYRDCNLIPLFNYVHSTGTWTNLISLSINAYTA
jgi:cyclopropane fatty-acyl-phospholipid synthase-like methyltransferase